MTHIEDVMLYAIAQEGKPYVYGAEADTLDPDPPAFDCSELVQWACGRAGVDPVMPDGAYWQYKHCANNGTLISVQEGIDTRGALLFRVVNSNPPNSYDDVPHVALSAGGGVSVEARGAAWGIGSWATAGRFQAAALIPGCEYDTDTHPPLSPPPSSFPSSEVTDVQIRVLAQGANGGDVRTLQSLLNTKGGKTLHVDGDFGPLTAAGVTDWQTFFGLTVDGVVGGQTWPTLLNF